MRKFHIYLIIILLINGFYVQEAWSSQVKGDRSLMTQERKFLVDLFKNSEIDQQFLRSVFNNRNLKKIPIVIQKNVNNVENKDNYQEFLSRYSLYLAYQFSKKWRSILHQASQNYNVDKEVLVAILLVETGLGNVLGRYPVISVFSSIILENHQVDEKSEVKERYKSEYQLNRLSEKAVWARQELESLLQIASNTDMNLFKLKGSFAGAFGIPQFLPSSYLKWGIDSDNNGIVNLFRFPDAIHSTANFLKAHGWKKGLYQKSNKKVIWHYNHSHIYVDTILKIATKIRRYECAKNDEECINRSS